MSKFKVGDKIKVINSDSVHYGRIGKLAFISTITNYVSVDFGKTTPNIIGGIKLSDITLYLAEESKLFKFLRKATNEK